MQVTGESSQNKYLKELEPPSALNVSSDYKDFVRPKVADFLTSLKLDVDYLGGKGNYLIAKDKQNNERFILDFTGGYGANILGHHNKELENRVDCYKQDILPAHLQGSIRKESAKLAKKLSNKLSSITGAKSFITNFSNSGTEAVEAALKMSLLKHEQNKKKIIFKINKEYNSFLLKLESTDDINFEEVNNIYNDLLKLNNIETKKVDIESIIDIKRAFLHQKKLLLEKLDYSPVFLTMENAFHGKTLGALNLTYNQTYKEVFGNYSNLKIISLDPKLDIDSESLTENSLKLYFPYFLNRENAIKLSFCFVNKIAACFIEPILGEGGVIEVNPALVSTLRSFCTKNNSLLIFDEIQMGLYRTGDFVASAKFNVKGDIYCFGKGLGGGQAKIAATCFSEDIYDSLFGYVHTSTFCEDDYSSFIALNVLDLIEKEEIQSNIETMSSLLSSKLENLKLTFGKMIKEIRGKGLVYAIELDQKIIETNYEFKLFSDLGLVGHLFSSALLNNENLRIAPTMSNPYSMRVGPSLFVNEIEIENFILAITSFLTELKKNNLNYFFDHVLDRKSVERSDVDSFVEFQPITKINPKLKTAVFLSHMIDSSVICKMFNIVKSKRDLEKVVKLNDEMLEDLEFEIYGVSEISGINGEKINFIMLSLPIPSELIFKTFRKNPYLIKQKIQNGVDKAKALGAHTVGLGQYTSIVSGNGLDLNFHDMNITTGNAYTVFLAAQAALYACSEKKIDVANEEIGIIGCTGNIGSISSVLLAKDFKKLSFFYHTKLSESRKLQESVYTILNDIVFNYPESLLSKKLITNGFANEKIENIVNFCDKENIKEFLKVTDDFEELISCSLIFSGTNTSKTLVFEHMIKKDTVIVDVSVPSNLDKKLSSKRDDVIILSGGIAKLPTVNDEDQIIIAPAFPLEKGQSFACMAETMMISLDNMSDTYHIGNITLKNIEKVNLLAQKLGFKLESLKFEGTY